jgi:2-keto-4-pentenoate hydratase
MAARDDNAISAAATLLWGHWTASTRLPELPAQCRPADRSDAYAIQAAVAKLSGQRIVGWKIAATSRVGQAHIGVDGPLAGSLLSDRVLGRPVDGAGHALVSLDGNLMRVAEAEFAFRLGRSLPARTLVYGVQEVLDAVDSLHPTIEVPDSRYEHFARVGALQLIADSACACWLIVGEASHVDWHDLDLGAHTVETFLNGTPAATGIGANVLRDPRLALTWLANELRTYGQGLQAGDLVTTGTCITPVALAPGDFFRADFGALGSLQVELW